MSPQSCTGVPTVPMACTGKTALRIKAVPVYRCFAWGYVCACACAKGLAECCEGLFSISHWYTGTALIHKAVPDLSTVGTVGTPVQGKK